MVTSQSLASVLQSARVEANGDCCRRFQRFIFMSIALLRFLALPILTVTLALAGCSTNKMIVSEWSNPGYASSSFRTIMVGGLGGQSSIGRNFEDEFVTQLKAAD